MKVKVKLSRVKKWTTCSKTKRVEGRRKKRIENYIEQRWTDEVRRN
jgi:hypothetical protein